MNDDVETRGTTTETEPAPSGHSGDGAPKVSGATSRARRRRGGRGRGGGSGRSSTAGSGRRAVEDDAKATGGEQGAGAPGEEAQQGGSQGSSTRRRRRRGGRGRGGNQPTAKTVGESDGSEPTAGGEDAGNGAPSEAAAAATTEGSSGRSASGTGSAAARRRRRRRRPSGTGGETGETAVDETSTVTAPEAAKAEGEEAPKAEAKGTAKRGAKRGAKGGAKRAGARTKEKPAAQEEKPEKGRGRRRTKKADAGSPNGVPTPTETPTRLSRSRSTRTRTGGRRRREPVPVVKRAQDKLMVITEKGERDQLAVLEDRDLVQHYVTRAGSRSMVGNVYLGRVQNVLPGMEAAFVDIGRGRNAVLYAGEVNYSADDLVEGHPPRIEHVLKSGQSVLVQVTKDPIGGKGARLTAQISVPGRYVVLVPDSDVTGISRRLPLGERRRIKAVVKRVRPDGYGMIVRTAADGVSEEAIAEDVQRVVAEWEAIKKRAKKAKAPASLYEEPEITVRVVRDLFTGEEFKHLVTDSQRIYDTVTSYLREVAPDLIDKVEFSDGKLPVFERFHIVEQLHKALDRKVWLPSGGYLIIERTEAMTVIDVNTGKHVGKTNLEETVVQTNLEAAREVARQLRLRDIGGIIIIDFIDMLLEKNKKLVEDTLKEAMAQDRTRSQVFEIGALGLCEVTRKRVSGGLLESFSETCPTCEGRGILLTHDI